MRRILYGMDFVSNRNRVLGEIAARAEQETEGLLLIVPENQSHEAERRLCEVCGNRISRFAEVVSLPRLATRLFAVVGGSAVAGFDRGGKLLAMSRTCKELRTQLKVFASRSGSADYLLSLVDLCDELESSLVTPDDLRRAGSDLTGALAQKIEEVAAISDVYAGVCRGHESALTRLAQLLRDRPELVADKRVWIDGFTYLTRQEREIALCLADSAADFTLVLTGEPDAEHDRVFGAVREFAADFRRLDAVWEQIVPEENRRAAALTYLSNRLFSAELTPYPTETSCVTLRKAPSVSAECLYCADAVLALTRSGARFRDIHVAYTDPARYRPVLAAVFARYGVPAYFAGAEPIENQSVAAFVLTVLDALSGGLELEDVLRHLKTGFCALTRDECDRLENYAYTWSIRGAMWLQDWTMHPGGYGQPDTEESARILAQLNEIRVRALTPLASLRRDLRDAQNVSGQLAALYRYFEAVDLCGALTSRADQLAGSQPALELAQLYELLCTALEQMDEILGREICSVDEFARLVRLLLTQYSVSTITPYLDSVQAGSAESLYRSPCRYLFVLGAEEGLLPANLTARGPLSDFDRDQLRRRGVPLLSGTQHDLDFAIASVWHLLSAPSEGLYFSWCAQDDKAPSYLLTRAQVLLGGLQAEECEPYPSILLSDADSAGALLARAGEDETLCAAAECCAVFSDETVKEKAARWRARASYRMTPMSKAAVHQLYGERLYLSASRVDQQNSCRFAYFMNYGMRAKERRQAAFDAPLFGTFVHAVLQNTASRAVEEGGFHAVAPERLQQIAAEEMTRYTNEQLGQLGNAGERLQYLFDRNRREISEIVASLGKELAKSDFLPVRFELSFSEGGEMPPVQIPGGEPAEISGFVDRVDVYEKDGVLYVRVIDYKTGRKSFDYTDILSGIGLQMLIYLFTLCELGEYVFGRLPKPAGVLYVPAREPVLGMPEKPAAEQAEKRHAAERMRKGLILDDEAIITAMEHAGDGRPEFLPVKAGKSGGYTGDLASELQMELLRSFVMERLRRTADEIASGDISPNPYTRGAAHGSCDYCPYAQACQLDTYDGAVRRLAATDRKLFWEKIEQEVGGNG